MLQLFTAHRGTYHSIYRICSGIQRCVAWYTGTKFSEQLTASLYRGTLN